MSRPKKPRRQLRVRPCLETLEDRTAPAIMFDWAIAAGSTGVDRGYGIAADGTGVYVTGDFEGTVDFDPGPGTAYLGSAGGSEGFVAKYSPSNALIWAQVLGGPGMETGNGIAVDNAGNTLVAGAFAYSYAAVAKLDPSGNILWKQALPDTPRGETIYPWAIAVDSAGNSYVTGGTTNFEDVYIAKLDPAGTVLWLKTVGQTGYGKGYGIAVDSAANVHVTGYYSGTADFDPGPGAYLLSSMTGRGGLSSYDAFVLKLDTTGNFIWAGMMGSANGNDVGYGVAVDSSSNVYLTGTWGGSYLGAAGANDFDPGPGTVKLSHQGESDLFVMKLDSNRNLGWVRNIGGPGGESAYGLALDAARNVYTTGYFEGAVDFDPGKGKYLLHAAGGDEDYDVFVSKLTGAGTFAAAVAMGGPAPGLGDHGRGIAVDAAANIWTTGFFVGAADFDPGSGTFNLSSAGHWDVFVSKLTQPAPLSAAGQFVSGRTAQDPLTVEQVEPLVAEAKARWQTGGVDTTGLGILEVRIGDLPDGFLGLAGGNIIWLDDNAAGWGWFVDPTPGHDSEFTTPGNQGEQNRMDLLTVLAHEIGHLLGYEHDEPGASATGDVMDETLDAGVRRLPGYVDQLDAAMLLDWFSAENRTNKR